jgi:hypothetical protein
MTLTGAATKPGTRALFQAIKEVKASEAFIKGFADPIEWSDDRVSQVLKGFEARLRNVARRFERHRDPILFQEEMQETLLEMHRAAYFAGMEMGGLVPPSATLARQRAGLVTQAEVQYLRAFGLALQNRDPSVYSLETEQFRIEMIEARAASYVGRGRGSGTDGWLIGGGNAAIVNWTMTAVEHCEDCPIMAANGPYIYGGAAQDRIGELAVLPFSPGENLTACLYNCKCVLRRDSDGAESPAPLNLAA